VAPVERAVPEPATLAEELRRVQSQSSRFLRRFQERPGLLPEASRPRNPARLLASPNPETSAAAVRRRHHRLRSYPIPASRGKGGIRLLPFARPCDAPEAAVGVVADEKRAVLGDGHSQWPATRHCATPERRPFCRGRPDPVSTRPWVWPGSFTLNFEATNVVLWLLLEW
jgi:hypothetical protein